MRFALIASVVNVGKSGFVKFCAVFARPFLGCIFPNFCRVIWFYEIKLEVKVDFCMFLVIYMFSKQISCWNRIGRQFWEVSNWQTNWQTASARSCPISYLEGNLTDYKSLKIAPNGPKLHRTDKYTLSNR